MHLSKLEMCVHNLNIMFFTTFNADKLMIYFQKIYFKCIDKIQNVIFDNNIISKIYRARK